MYREREMSLVLGTRTFSDELASAHSSGGLCDAQCREGHWTIAVPRSLQTVSRRPLPSTPLAARLAFDSFRLLAFGSFEGISARSNHLGIFAPTVTCHSVRPL